MVEEIVPFPKDSLAAVMSATKKANDSVLFKERPVLVDDKVIGFWRVLFDPNLFQVKVLAQHDTNFVILVLIEELLFLFREISNEVKLEHGLDFLDAQL